MSVYVNQQVTAVANNLTTEQRNILRMIQAGMPFSIDHRSLGQMIRAGLVQLGSGGGISLSMVGMRIANA